LNFKKWVKSIQTAGYNGARTVSITQRDPTGAQLVDLVSLIFNCSGAAGVYRTPGLGKTTITVRRAAAAF
jgi:hypothetical protein